MSAVTHVPAMDVSVVDQGTISDGDGNVLYDLATARQRALHVSRAGDGAVIVPLPDDFMWTLGNIDEAFALQGPTA